MEEEDKKTNMEKQLSIIIPVYNEEKIVTKTIEGLKSELNKISELKYEIITINDASTDKSREVLEKINDITVVNHSQNKGYGASLKTGIKEAKFNNLLFFDADGQHKPEYVAEMLKHIDSFDLISGARTGYKGPIVRQPGKKILKWIAQYLSKQTIPDLNCGLRIVKKDKIQKFLYLLCDEFSFSTTTLLMFASEELPIKYVPITINKREGKSKVKPKHAIDTLIFILRSILLFSPLRIFLPVSGLIAIIACVSLILDIIHSLSSSFNVGEITILFFLSSFLIFFFGLLADQVSTVRKEIKHE